LAEPNSEDGLIGTNLIAASGELPRGLHDIIAFGSEADRNQARKSTRVCRASWLRVSWWWKVANSFVAGEDEKGGGVSGEVAAL
jgi:hypothetical protein